MKVFIEFLLEELEDSAGFRFAGDWTSRPGNAEGKGNGEIGSQRTIYRLKACNLRWKLWQSIRLRLIIQPAFRDTGPVKGARAISQETNSIRRLLPSARFQTKSCLGDEHRRPGNDNNAN